MRAHVLPRLLVAGCALAAAIILLRPLLSPAPTESLVEPWALLRVNATEAVGRLARVVVGVVDSGVDASHPALEGRVLPGIDFVDGGPGTEDPLGHGTQVAGIIAAHDQVGVAGNAVILPVRVLDANGFGSVGRLGRGIRWAADHDARVINTSVETADRGRALKTAIEYAWARSAVVVAIAGNEGGGVQWPAAYGLDLVAPGVGVRTTTTGGGYVEASGTSVAAPFVSGAAALLLGQEPELTNADVVARLRGSARDLGAAGSDERFGAGLLDIAAALES